MAEMNERKNSNPKNQENTDFNEEPTYPIEKPADQHDWHEQHEQHGQHQPNERNWPNRPNWSSAQRPPMPMGPRRRWSFDVKTVLILLLALSTGFLLAARYSNTASTGEERTVSVTGEATLKETPDEFVFYPNYTVKNADKSAGLAELTKKSDEIVAKLKGLGVASEKIKVNSSGGDPGPINYSDKMSTDASYSLQLTITVSDKALAQKVQDYLATTTPTGQVSPQASFSDAKRKQLESKARDQATQEARSKAEQSAKNLGFKVGRVKSVSDGVGFGGQTYMDKTIAPATTGANGVAVEASPPQLAVQPGLNDIHYSVSVVYVIK